MITNKEIEECGWVFGEILVDEEEFPTAAIVSVYPDDVIIDGYHLMINNTNWYELYIKKVDNHVITKNGIEVPKNEKGKHITVLMEAKLKDKKDLLEQMDWLGINKKK